MEKERYFWEARWLPGPNADFTFTILTTQAWPVKDKVCGKKRCFLTGHSG